MEILTPEFVYLTIFCILKQSYCFLFEGETPSHDVVYLPHKRVERQKHNATTKIMAKAKLDQMAMETKVL